MAARPALLGQVSWMLAGNVSYAGCQWGILMILTKMVPPAMVGQFGLGLAISVPVLMFTNFQLRSLQATGASLEFGINDYLGFRLLSSAFAVAAIVGIVIANGFSTPTGLVVMAVGLAKCVESVADTIYGHLQQAEMMKRIGKSMVMKGAVSLLFLGSAVALTGNVLWGVLALCFGWALVLILYDIPSALIARTNATAAVPRLYPTLNLRTMAAIARMGLPLGVASLFLGLSVNVPRIFLARWYGEAALGYFAALSYPTTVFSILLGSFGQAAAPRLADYWNRDRLRFWRLVASLALVPVVVALLVFGAVLLRGRELISTLYRPDYAEHVGVLLVLVGAGTLWALASVLGYAATASRRLTAQAPAAAVICGVAVWSSSSLVHARGLEGAGYAALIAGGAAMITYLFLMVRRV
jgi:O-antigen/teichoic acid export membrane protein